MRYSLKPELFDCDASEFPIDFETNFQGMIDEYRDDCLNEVIKKISIGFSQETHELVKFHADYAPVTKEMIPFLKQLDLFDNAGIQELYKKFKQIEDKSLPSFIDRGHQYKILSVVRRLNSRKILNKENYFKVIKFSENKIFLDMLKLLLSQNRIATQVNLNKLFSLHEFSSEIVAAFQFYRKDDHIFEYIDEDFVNHTSFELMLQDPRFARATVEEYESLNKECWPFYYLEEFLGHKYDKVQQSDGQRQTFVKRLLSFKKSAFVNYMLGKIYANEMWGNSNFLDLDKAQKYLSQVPENCHWYELANRILLDMAICSADGSAENMATCIELANKAGRYGEFYLKRLMEYSECKKVIEYRHKHPAIQRLYDKNFSLTPYFSMSHHHVKPVMDTSILALLEYAEAETISSSQCTESQTVKLTSITEMPDSLFATSNSNIQRACDEKFELSVVNNQDDQVLQK